jgi:mxaD protein
MKMISVCALAMSVMAAGNVLAAAPGLSVNKSVTINASVDKVWDTAKNFDSLNAWHPAVAKDEIIEGKNNTVGAVRKLTLQDGGTIKEKLLSFDAANHTFKYAILEGVVPVSGYTSTFTVKAAGKDSSTATWSGNFKRKNVGDKPGPHEDDKTATDTVSSIYQSGLDNLKKVLETK